MYCVHCGKEIEDKSNVCSYCGAQIKNTNKNNDSEVNKTSRDGRDIVSFILGMVTFVIGVLPTYFTVFFSIPLIGTGITAITLGAIKYKKSTFAKCGFYFGIVGTYQVGEISQLDLNGRVVAPAKKIFFGVAVDICQTVVVTPF